MPTALGSHAAGMLEGRLLVVAGGSNWSQDRTKKFFHADTQLCEAGKWKPGPSLPQPAVEASFACDGKMLCLVGGLRALDTPTNQVVALSADREMGARVTSLPDFPVLHSGGAAAILNSRLYVAGGFVAGRLTNKFWMLDLGGPSKKWIELPPFPGESRAYPALVDAGGQLYLLGGLVAIEKTKHVFKDVFQFDPQSTTWRRIGELPAAGYCWRAASLGAAGHQLVVGGRADEAIHDDLWIVDLPNLTTRSIGQSVTPTTCAALARVDESTFWLMGGEPDANKTRTNRITEIRFQ